MMARARPYPGHNLLWNCKRNILSCSFHAPLSSSLLFSLSLSFSPSPFGFRTIGIERRNGRSLEQRRDETRKRKRRRGRERTSVMTGRRKNSQLTLASRCRVGVIGFAENFYVFSRHLHNVRGEHGRSIG